MGVRTYVMEGEEGQEDSLTWVQGWGCCWRKSGGIGRRDQGCCVRGQIWPRADLTTLHSPRVCHQRCRLTECAFTHPCLILTKWYHAYMQCALETMCRRRIKLLPACAFRITQLASHDLYPVVRMRFTDGDWGNFHTVRPNSRFRTEAGASHGHSQVSKTHHPTHSRLQPSPDLLFSTSVEAGSPLGFGCLHPAPR